MNRPVLQSLKVKASYIDQLRNLDLISASFMPTVLGLLNLDQGSSKVFRLEPWTIDEFYVSCKCSLTHTHMGHIH